MHKNHIEAFIHFLNDHDRLSYVERSFILCFQELSSVALKICTFHSTESGPDASFNYPAS